VIRRVLEVALLAGACACAPALALAQSADPPPPPAAATATAPAEAATVPSTPTPPAAPANVIPAGTLVTLVITEPLSSGKSKSGDRFGFKLAEPIVVGGVVLMPAGAVGQGEVIDAKPANIGGRPGRLVLAARYLDAGPLHVTLQSFKLGGGGKDHSELAVEATIAVGIVGVLIPGGGVDYQVGTYATAKVAADVTTAVAAAPIPAAATASSTPTPSP
jgi:hypothetical protein